VETSAIVADGMMYVTEPPTTVTALDPRNGRPIWSYVRPMPSDLRLIGFPATNRGVAILDDKVFVGSLDGALVALDAGTGAVRWETQVADNGTGHSITMAPLAVNGKVIVGISGGEAGIRGFVDAYDAKTGTRVWRTYTVPAAGDPGGDSWAGDSWKNGAGATWLTGSFDPGLNLLYWGTGNPEPARRCGSFRLAARCDRIRPRSWWTDGSTCRWPPAAPCSCSPCPTRRSGLACSDARRSLLARRQPPADGRDECLEVAEVMVEDVAHDGKVHLVVPVDQHVAEPRHVAQRVRQRSIDPSVSLKEIEQLAVRPRLAEASVRYDVRCHVERGLDGNLQRVLDESLLPHVRGQHFGPGQPVEVRQARLDQRQLLRDE